MVSEPGSSPGEGVGEREGTHLECSVAVADDYACSGACTRAAIRAIAVGCCCVDGGALILIHLPFHLCEVRSSAVHLSCFPYLRDPA